MKHEALERHLAAQATGLAMVLTPLTAAGLMIGAGLALLMKAHGSDFARRYLDDLSLNLDDAHDDEA